MSFSEFISNFWFRRRVESDFERYQDIKPPENPSRRYIDKLVRRLLKEDTAWEARRELDMIGAAAVPALLDAIGTPPFQRAMWKTFSTVPAPLDATLELLVKHAPDEVVRISSPLARSSSEEVRKTAAIHLASAGRGSTIPILKELMEDDDGYVRSYVQMGIQRAVSAEHSDEEFRTLAYELLLSQLDKDWGSAGNDSATAMIELDPKRAAVDLSDERWLTTSNCNTYRIVEACIEASILLPEQVLIQLFGASLHKAVREHCYPDDYVASNALLAMAHQGSSSAHRLAEQLLHHENKKVREVAAKSLTVLAGISDPTGFMSDLVHKDGFEVLSPEQRVVYCAFLFDMEVCNGGLMQFFANSSGDHVEDTLEALAVLGHDEAHTAMQAAIRLVGPLSKEANRELRLTAFEGRWEELSAAFRPLETAYFATNVQLRQAWLLYATRHAAQFRR